MLARSERGGSPEFKAQVVAALPRLRRQAIALCRDAVRAEDLVQETALRAMASACQFTPGTNFGAWLTTIMRNEFRHEYRKLRREVEDPEGFFAATLSVEPEAPGRVALNEAAAAIERLPLALRAAVQAVVVNGLTYEQAAAAGGVALGTVKSRLFRAREILERGPPRAHGKERSRCRSSL